MSYAGAIETGYMVDQESRAASLARFDVMLASGKVAQQLEVLGVDKALVTERIQGLSNSELLMLETEMDRLAAGGDALALIGAVFLVLLILELVGVTDIFKSI
ncbi:MAG: PA2779 family protein [Woeseiaceae bacterium]|nr:PA2779 family protein [Woeseiaceae bacterium]